jgi:peptidoglycan/xylan/chitin deacetylase (PgdA/CDA1 family)
VSEAGGDVPTFLIGYDVESDDPEVTRRFLAKARAVHEDLGVSCSLFIVGRTLRRSPVEFAELVDHPLFDLHQHTDTHMLLKTVYQQNEGGTEVFRGGSLEEVSADVARAQETFQDLLGFRPLGLTGPFGYYRGLCDRPDIVAVVAGEGIRLLRCWSRDQHDWQPVEPFAPFRLDAIGFPGVWEYGIHGWQDCLLREQLGWAEHDAYFDRLRSDIDQAVASTAYFSYAQHDWSSIREDPDMTLTRRILAYAQERGMRIVDYAGDYSLRADTILVNS